DNADPPLAEARGADPERRVEAVEVDERQQRGELDDLLVAEVLPHPGEQFVAHLDGCPHHPDGEVEGDLFALGEQLTGAVARERASSSAPEKPELRQICEPRSTQYSHPIICAPFSSTRFLIRSSTDLPLRIAWLNLPIPIIIFGW